MSTDAVPATNSETSPATPPAPPTPAAPRAKGPPQPGAPRRGGDRPPFPGNRGPGGGNKPRFDGPPPEPARLEFGAFKPNKRSLDADIEAELALAMADSTGITAALDEKQAPKVAGTPGSKKKGTIVAFHGKDVFVEIPGGRSQGVLPIQQFEGKAPKIGDVVEVDVERYDSANGLLLLTMTGAVQSVTDWSSVALGMIVEAKCTGLNKNKTGLLVEVNGIKGFMPVSQCDLYRTENPEQYENQRIKCMVIELNPEERNLILSRRAVLEKERQAAAAEFWSKIEEGQVRKGIIKSVKPFGAFVDLGGADGLIPISEFSWQRVTNLEELVKPGQEVEVKVARLDFENRKIGLSLKALTKNPFDDFANEHRPGMRLPGKVTRLMEFGAFVELVPGIEGLIHISELSANRVRRVMDIVAEGDAVTVQILNIDPQTRRIALSLKAMEVEAEAATEAAAVAESEADKVAAAERLAARVPAANLRTGTGAAPLHFGGTP